MSMKEYGKKSYLRETFRKTACAILLICFCVPLIPAGITFADGLAVERFDDTGWASRFDVGAAVGRTIVDDPAGSGEKCLEISHTTQTASWIRNKTSYGGMRAGNYTVSADLYVPKDALATSGDTIQFIVSGDSNHRGELVSDSTATLTAFQTKDFPREKWFTLRFVFRLDEGKYNVEVVEDGQVKTTIFKDRGCSSLTADGGVGLTNMRLHLSGTNQKIYVDNMGIAEVSSGDYRAVEDFEADTWPATFATGASPALAAVSNPDAGIGGKVLEYTHESSKAASWIRMDLGQKKSGYYIVGADLYIPSSALPDAEDYVRLMINGNADHWVGLYSDQANITNPFQTKQFPRDKWFKVEFQFSLDDETYNVLILEDGKAPITIFSARSTITLTNDGLNTLQFFVAGDSQTVYVDNIGIYETEKPTEPVEIPPNIQFIRVEGENQVGSQLSLYCDFVGTASMEDISNIQWKSASTRDGTFEPIVGATEAVWTPDASFESRYVIVTATFTSPQDGTTKQLESLPVMIYPADDKMLDLKLFLTADGTKADATAVYTNNGEAAADATLLGALYRAGKLLETKTESKSFEPGSGSLVLEYSFASEMKEGDIVKLFALNGTDNLQPLAKAAETTVGTSSSLPEIEVVKGSSTYVTMNGEQIAHFKDNRYMHFRATTANDHWIGTNHNPVDMGWAYQEPDVKGFICTSVESEVSPGRFSVTFRGDKEGVGASQVVTLEGIWNAKIEQFEYTYTTKLSGDLAKWHSKSKWAQGGSIEAFDYNSERMSILDRVYNNNTNGDLYDYVVYTDNGKDWIRIPKLPVPRTMINGTYFYDFYLSPGGKYLLADAKEGGWEATLLKDTGDTRIEICWSWYDIHNCMERAVPPLGSADTFELEQSWSFRPTDGEYDKAVIDSATEVDWRDIPNYKLPTFSTNNTFDTQFGGTDWCYAWWLSSYDCTMDSTVGHTDTSSAAITHDTKKNASWYTEGVWGFPYSFDNVKGKRYRLSGWIKTENVEGEAKIGVNQYLHATPNNNKFTYSEPVSGTRDWTYVSCEFTGQMRPLENGGLEACIDHFYLTLDGSGKAWFDDVVIEEIESDDPKLVVNPALTFESGEITNNGNATSNGMRMWMISDTTAVSNSQITNEVVDVETGKALKTTLLNSTAVSVNSKYVVMGGKTALSFRIKLEEGAKLDVYFRPGSAAGKVTFLSTDGTSNTLKSFGKTAMENIAGEWAYVTMYFDNDTKEMDLFVNGVPVLEKHNIGQTADYSGSNNDIRFELASANGQPVSMYLDDLQAYQILKTKVLDVDVVENNSQIVVKFNNAVDLESVRQNVKLLGESECAFTASLSNDLHTAVLVPAEPLDSAKEYSVEVGAVQDIAGNTINAQGSYPLYLGQ